MRHNWTYKKLGDVATIIGGSTPLTSNPANWKGSNRWVTPAELDGSKYIGDTQRTISDEAASKLSLLPVGTVLFSSRAPIGKVAITTKPMYCNQGFKNVVCGDELLNEYVYLYLTHNVPTLQALGVGATFKEISKSKMEQFAIPVPPIHEQKELVQELNSIKHLIELQEQQAVEYDKLAQSLFYSTFGDPIINPHGWAVKKLGDYFQIGSSKRVFQSEWKTKGVPFYRAREVVKLAKDGFVDNELFIDEELYDHYAQKYGIPAAGDILVTGVGTLGITYVVRAEDKFYYKDGNIICLHKKENIDSVFVDYLFKTPYLRAQIENCSGATVGTFTIDRAKKTEIIVPPLELQQSFAAQIEAIEKQKALIRKSLDETRTLLAARMQYYFE